MRISDWSSDVCSSDLAVFDVLAKDWGKLDFLVHAIGFSDKNELKGRYLDTSPDNFTLTMNVSCYSFRSEEHTSELQSLMRISYAVFCLKRQNTQSNQTPIATTTTQHHLLHRKFAAQNSTTH